MRASKNEIVVKILIGCQKYQNRFDIFDARSRTQDFDHYLASQDGESSEINDFCYVFLTSRFRRRYY